MNILTISVDRKLFDSGSDVSKRMIACGGMVDSWHIVVFNVKNNKQFYKDQSLSNNVFVYPINSLVKATYFFSALRVMSRILYKNKIDIITTQDSFELGLLGWWVRMRHHLPLQLQVHTDILSPYYRKESLHNRLRYFIAMWLVKRANGIRVVSSRIASSLINKWHIDSSRIFQLPVLIDSDKLMSSDRSSNWLKDKYPQFEHIFLMASRFSKEKNIALAIESMVTIVKECPRVGLIIIGEGLEKGLLESLVKKLLLEDNVVFLSWKENLADYYKGADAFILSSNYEGYAMTIVEAMMMGQLVIATDVGIVGEILINMENGLVVPVGDQKKLTEAMNTAISNKELGKQLQERAISIKSKVLGEKEFLESYKETLEKTIKNYD
ncbi:MAG: hypothetical protein COU81_03865 [Candidatus Portnoybacteria bacterium CG10_big_fil_rev_8_21_14_0_10_36_7]|uniref:Glycosyl transferase family 1 domain-containing protein n=1 Tax=Candidatus Portnoybacteria bacterium CG10_big_fil_rev_8_21_14_0_10_36_7 TaxID=1974812 RepID=A0A2M8KD62_9BACT|nr:MAG: hypothetical protein COU81_03865 [Candidatus Portnoybacteria bacterium CG10_big_fil_rev_8_21_14_0_10_36_7]